MGKVKHKTHKASRKRFKVTAKGKVTHRSPNRGHIMGKKPGKRKRQLRGSGLLVGTFAKKIAQSLGE